MAKQTPYEARRQEALRGSPADLRRFLAEEGTRAQVHLVPDELIQGDLPDNLKPGYTSPVAEAQAEIAESNAPLAERAGRAVREGVSSFFRGLRGRGKKAAAYVDDHSTVSETDALPGTLEYARYVEAKGGNLSKLDKALIAGAGIVREYVEDLTPEQRRSFGLYNLPAERLEKLTKGMGRHVMPGKKPYEVLDGLVDPDKSPYDALDELVVDAVQEYREKQGEVEEAAPVKSTKVTKVGPHEVDPAKVPKYIAARKDALEFLTAYVESDPDADWKDLHPHPLHPDSVNWSAGVNVTKLDDFFHIVPAEERSALGYGDSHDMRYDFLLGVVAQHFGFPIEGITIEEATEDAKSALHRYVKRIKGKRHPADIRNIPHEDRMLLEEAFFDVSRKTLLATGHYSTSQIVDEMLDGADAVYQLQFGRVKKKTASKTYEPQVKPEEPKHKEEGKKATAMFDHYVRNGHDDEEEEDPVVPVDLDEDEEEDPTPVYTPAPADPDEEEEEDTVVPVDPDEDESEDPTPVYTPAPADPDEEETADVKPVPGADPDLVADLLNDPAYTGVSSTGSAATGTDPISTGRVIGLGAGSILDHLPHISARANKILQAELQGAYDAAEYSRDVLDALDDNARDAISSAVASFKGAGAGLEFDEMVELDKVRDQLKGAAQRKLLDAYVSKVVASHNIEEDLVRSTIETSGAEGMEEILRRWGDTTIQVEDGDVVEDEADNDGVGPLAGPQGGGYASIDARAQQIAEEKAAEGADNTPRPPPLPRSLSALPGAPMDGGDERHAQYDVETPAEADDNIPQPPPLPNADPEAPYVVVPEAAAMVSFGGPEDDEIPMAPAIELDGTPAQLLVPEAPEPSEPPAGRTVVSLEEIGSPDEVYTPIGVGGEAATPDAALEGVGTDAILAMAAAAIDPNAVEDVHAGTPTTEEPIPNFRVIDDATDPNGAVGRGDTEEQLPPPLPNSDGDAATGEPGVAGLPAPKLGPSGLPVMPDYDGGLFDDEELPAAGADAETPVALVQEALGGLGYSTEGDGAGEGPALGFEPVGGMPFSKYTGSDAEVGEEGIAVDGHMIIDGEPVEEDDPADDNVKIQVYKGLGGDNDAERVDVEFTHGGTRHALSRETETETGRRQQGGAVPEAAYVVDAEPVTAVGEDVPEDLEQLVLEENGEESRKNGLPPLPAEYKRIRAVEQKLGVVKDPTKRSFLERYRTALLIEDEGERIRQSEHVAKEWKVSLIEDPYERGRAREELAISILEDGPEKKRRAALFETAEAHRRDLRNLIFGRPRQAQSGETAVEHPDNLQPSLTFEKKLMRARQVAIGYDPETGERPTDAERIRRIEQAQEVMTRFKQAYGNSEQVVRAFENGAIPEKDEYPEE